MKKILCFATAVLCIVTVLSFSAFALENKEFTPFEKESFDNVNDYANILDNDEKKELNEKAKEIMQKYKCGVYIVTVDSYDEISEGTIEQCSEKIMENYVLGYGDNHDSIMLLLSVNNRKYDIDVYGDFSSLVFTPDIREHIAAEFIDDFKDEDWYYGFLDYLDECEYALDDNINGTTSGGLEDLIIAFLLSLVIAFIISLIVCFIIRGSMKSVSEKSNAENYVGKSGLKLTVSEDKYTHTTEVRVYSPQNKDNSKAGNSSVGSGGNSHTSGSF